MRKILLTAFLLTAALSVAPVSHAEKAKVQADKKLPWAVAATVDLVLSNFQMILVSQTFTKERNVYMVEAIATADYDATGDRLYRVLLLINNRGTLITTSFFPID